MLGKKGRVPTVPEEMLVQAHRVTPTHSASKTTLSWGTQSCSYGIGTTTFWHQTPAQIHSWMVNMCTKWPKISLTNSQTSHKPHCLMSRHLLRSHLTPDLGQPPAGSVPIHSLGRWRSPEIIDFLGCLTHKAAPQDLHTCPSSYSKWALAIFEKPSQAHLPTFQLPQALKQKQYYFPHTYS